jgi:hypothetical protein
MIGNPELEGKRGGVNKREKHEDKMIILETLTERCNSYLYCTLYQDGDLEKTK